MIQSSNLASLQASASGRETSLMVIDRMQKATAKLVKQETQSLQRSQELAFQSLQQELKTQLQTLVAAQKAEVSKLQSWHTLAIYIKPVAHFVHHHCLTLRRILFSGMTETDSLVLQISILLRFESSTDTHFSRRYVCIWILWELKRTSADKSWLTWIFQASCILGHWSLIMPLWQVCTLWKVTLISIETQVSQNPCCALPKICRRL